VGGNLGNSHDLNLKERHVLADPGAGAELSQTPPLGMTALSSMATTHDQLLQRGSKNAEADEWEGRDGRW